MLKSEDHDLSKKQYASVSDPVRPNHYFVGTPFEVIPILFAWGFEECALLWQVLTYIIRNGKKPGQDAVQDLKKARFYLDLKIKRLEDGINK